MERDLVIFGSGELAEVVEYYFRADAHRKIAGFAVDDAYLRQPQVCGLPVLPMSELVRQWPPSSHDVFVAIGYTQLNRARRAKAGQLGALGYRGASFVSSRAVVADDVRIGTNCLVLEHNTLQPFVQVADNVVLWSGNHIGHHSQIGNACFITSHVVVAGGVRIGEETFVGINAAISDHVTVGRRNILGAGSLILHDTADESVYVSEGTPRSTIPSARMERLLTAARVRR